MAALLAKYDGGFYALVLVKLLASLRQMDPPARTISRGRGLAASANRILSEHQGNEKHAKSL
jgi:hypothetical protein